jgi:hypothetical protein
LAGEMLFNGDYLLSINLCFNLTVQDDGNLVLRQVRTGNIVWAANKFSKFIHNVFFELNIFQTK